MAETLLEQAVDQAPVIEIIKFEGGAHFLAAQGLRPEQVRAINIARKFAFRAQPVIGVEDCYFAQVTDTMLPTIQNLINMGSIPVVNKTPEDLVGQDFKVDAILAGLGSAVILATDKVDVAELAELRIR